MVNNLSRYACTGLLLALVAGCASGNEVASRAGGSRPAQQAGATQPAAALTGGPNPKPPIQACELAHVADFKALLRDATSVAKGVIPSAGVSTSGEDVATTEYRFQVEKRYFGRDLPPEIIIRELGGVPQPLLSPGRYVLFLIENDAGYGVAGGFRGRFPVTDDGRLRQECVNYDDPASPRRPSGDPRYTEAEFEDRLRQAAR